MTKFPKRSRYKSGKYFRFARSDASSAPHEKSRNPTATERINNLLNLLPMSEVELRDNSADTRQHIILRLRSALRSERRRGRAGHWTYDLNRHIALYQALDLEIRYP